MREFWKTLGILVFLFLLALFLTRLSSPKQIDDVSPQMNCDTKYLEKSDMLWVVPRYDNIPISANQTWCKYILSLNKTLGLHGVYHTYNEFSTDRDALYLVNGMIEFENCFGYQPTMFKAPQLEISNNNKDLIDKAGLKLRSWLNQITSKVYHCDNSGYLPNWFVNLY